MTEELLKWLNTKIEYNRNMADKIRNPYSGIYDKRAAERYEYEAAMFEEIKKELENKEKPKTISISPLVLTQEEVDRQELKQLTYYIYDQVAYVCKSQGADSESEVVKIMLKSGPSINIHLSTKGIRFKNMELNKRYTLPELRVYCPYGTRYTNGD